MYIDPAGLASRLNETCRLRRSSSLLSLPMFGVAPQSRPEDGLYDDILPAQDRKSTNRTSSGIQFGGEMTCGGIRYLTRLKGGCSARRDELRGEKI